VKAFFSIVIGVVGLLMSTCGLVFSGLSTGGSSGGVLMISVPSIIVGGLFVWGAVALWRSWRKSKTTTTAQAAKTSDRAPP
jgi:hypothetical protein